MSTSAVTACDAQYKFQKLDVYQMALEYLDRIYELTKLLPHEEKYNLTSQLHRAGKTFETLRIRTLL